VSNANDKYFEPKPVHGFDQPPEKGKAVKHLEAGTNVSACTQVCCAWGGCGRRRRLLACAGLPRGMRGTVHADAGAGCMQMQIQEGWSVPETTGTGLMAGVQPAQAKMSFG